jgi:hypothetical protein
MEIYVAWYTGDPEYQAIDLNANLVVSLTNVSMRWNVKKWNFLPRKLIVNAGVVEKRKKLGLKNPKDVLLRQLEIIDDCSIETFICPPDFPLPRKPLHNFDLDQILNENIKNAKIYYQEFQKLASSLPQNIKLMGIIHGYDEESLFRVVKELTNIGYCYFALGSQEAKSRLDRGSIASFINKLIQIVKYLHVLGVTSVDLHQKYIPLSLIHSVDSATPIKESYNNGIYFSHPLRRFKVCTERLNINWIKNWGYASLVCNPFRVNNCDKSCKKVEEHLKHRIVNFTDLPVCKCPVCRKFGQVEGLFRTGRKVFNNRRALHNYFHLKKEFETIITNPFREREGCMEFIH